MAKHGGKTVFFGRFFAVLRYTAAWIAGLARMHWWRFLFWNAAGGIVWATLVGLVAYYGGQLAADAIQRYGIYAFGDCGRRSVGARGAGHPFRQPCAASDSALGRSQSFGCWSCCRRRCAGDACRRSARRGHGLREQEERCARDGAGADVQRHGVTLRSARPGTTAKPRPPAEPRRACSLRSSVGSKSATRPRATERGSLRWPSPSHGISAGRGGIASPAHAHRSTTSASSSYAPKCWSSRAAVGRGPRRDACASARRRRVVPLTQLRPDLRAQRLPDFAFVVPDLCHWEARLSVAAGDTWPKSQLPPLLALPQTVVFVMLRRRRDERPRRRPRSRARPRNRRATRRTLHGDDRPLRPPAHDRCKPGGCRCSGGHRRQRRSPALAVTYSAAQTSSFARTRAITSSVNSVVPSVAAEIGRAHARCDRFEARFADRTADVLRTVVGVCEQRRAREDHRHRVRDVLAVERRRGAVRGFGHAAPRGSKSSSNATISDSEPAIEPKSGSTRSERMSPSRLSAGITSGSSGAARAAARTSRRSTAARRRRPDAARRRRPSPP